MERRRGVILRKELPAGLAAITRASAGCASCSSTRSSISTRSTTPPPGLGDFGKPAGYIERQVTRLDRALRRLADRRHPGDDRGRRVARRAHAGRRRARADPQRLQVRQRDLRSVARAHHRRARLGDGDDRRSADGSRHVAVVLGRRPTTPRCFQMPIFGVDDEARHDDARTRSPRATSSARAAAPITSSSSTRSVCSRPP